MAMKKKYLLGLCMLVCGSPQIQGAEQTDSLNNINIIKRDTMFIYAESTMKDAIEALSGANAVLELKIYDWLHSNHPNESAQLLVENSKNKWFNIHTSRGKYNRVFVYVSKHHILPEKKEKQTDEETQTIEIEDVQVQQLSPEEENMSAIDSFGRIEPYVNRLKEEGRLRAYGKYASLPENEPCYIFVYDRDGNIVAVLRQSENGLHYNLRSQNDDNVKNYKNCGAIWLQLK